MGWTINKSSFVSNNDFKILFIMSLGPEKNDENLLTWVVLVTYPTKLIFPPLNIRENNIMMPLNILGEMNN